MTARYTVQKGETAMDVAHRYTGDASRYVDLIPVNPHLQTVTGQMGKPMFDPRDWHDGLSVKLPDRWVERGQMHGRVGYPRASRGKGTEVPTYTTSPTMTLPNLPPRMAIPNLPPRMAIPRIARDAQTPLEKQMALMYPRKWARRKENWLAGAVFGPNEDVGKNVDNPYEGSATPGTGNCPWSRDTDVKPYWFLNSKGEILENIAKNWLGNAWMQGNSINTTKALMKVNADLLDGNCNWLRNGVNIIRIPKLWPAPPVMYKDQIVKADGTKYVFTGGEGDDNIIPGSDDVERINVSEGDSSTIFWLLAGGVAIGAAIIALRAKKGRK